MTVLYLHRCLSFSLAVVDRLFITGASLVGAMDSKAHGPW